MSSDRDDPGSTLLRDGERTKMIAAAADHLAKFFDILGIDYRADHNTRETPIRVARMFVEELLRGKFNPPPDLTDFDNVESFDELIVMGPIDVRSTCAHHLMPIFGDAYIGVLPSTSGRIIGLSKYDRVVDYFSGRFQIQEELVQHIGQYIMARTLPRGVAVRISAVHTCKTQRGVRASYRSRMVTTSYFGALSNDERRRDEFLRECSLLERAPAYG